MGETPPRKPSLQASSGVQEGRFGGKGLFGSILLGREEVVGTPEEEEMRELFVEGTDDEGE